MADSDEPIHTLNVTFDQLLAVGGVYSNHVHVWFTQHEITMDFLTQSGSNQTNDGIAEATLVARIKVAPSAIGPMLQQIAQGYETWIETATESGFHSIDVDQHTEDDEND
ncbi:MAG: hypothetical protein OXB92_05200 [Acidimicrobiaceae bacterium]|nr:hypothetical protein [Acidimicrobiia bacterium]MCY4493236.1 hypothetical protein [Acidimicrobiaceae bacterium]